MTTTTEHTRAMDGFEIYEHDGITPVECKGDLPCSTCRGEALVDADDQIRSDGDTDAGQDYALAMLGGFGRVGR